MLPQPVADQLKISGKIEPESYDSVSIFFSDIVGFTAISHQSTPRQVVNMLHILYRTYDEILENYDCYKVETIGDAYMVASGLPNRNGEKHIEAIADFSLELNESLKSFEIPHFGHKSAEKDRLLKIRIGLHTGSVVAGVVGTAMPRYCLFGDTVNTASRMESNSLPQKIHCSDKYSEKLIKTDRYILEKRGIIELKNRGTMETHWLVSYKSGLPNYRNTQFQKGLASRRYGSLASGLGSRENLQFISEGNEDFNSLATGSEYSKVLMNDIGEEGDIFLSDRCFV